MLAVVHQVKQTGNCWRVAAPIFVVKLGWVLLVDMRVNFIYILSKVL